MIFDIFEIWYWYSAFTFLETEFLPTFRRLLWTRRWRGRQQRGRQFPLHLLQPPTSGPSPWLCWLCWLCWASRCLWRTNTVEQTGVRLGSVQPSLVTLFCLGFNWPSSLWIRNIWRNYLRVFISAHYRLLFSFLQLSALAINIYRNSYYTIINNFFHNLEIYQFLGPP